mgnify:CR=1 FL=1
MSVGLFCLFVVVVFVCLFFFFKQRTAYEIRLSLVGSEMCIRGRGVCVGFWVWVCVGVCVGVCVSVCVCVCVWVCELTIDRDR